MSDGAIDVTLVAGCRPDLLAATLSSFGEMILRNFRVVRAVANIDPVFGSDAEGDACERLVLARFPGAEVIRPREPGFGQAVKSVWGRTGPRPVLHMEDDWRALERVEPAMVLPRLAPDVGMVMLAQKPRAPDDADEVRRTTKLRVLGLTVARRQVNGYGTSPRFIAAGLAARYAALLDPRLDPEKQVLEERNPRLSALQRRFRCIKIWTPDGAPLIEDLGRDWLRSRNLAKVYRKSEVAWVDRPEV